MKTITPILHAVGKTIQCVTASQHEASIAIVFTDNTFSMLDVRMCPGSDDDPQIVDGGFNVMFFGKRASVESGIMTQEEVDEFVEREVLSQRKKRVAQDKAAYLRLKSIVEDNEARERRGELP